MDEDGAVKFPADKLEAVLTNVQLLQKQEADRMNRLQKATSAAEVRAIFSGQSYEKK
jgi:4-hydroxy-4-methyl-2-oxoglutarate aldolase